MTEGVKAGQVWQHKNSGRRVEVMRRVPGPYVWMVRNSGVLDAEARPIPESILVDDYILVSDAP